MKILPRFKKLQNILAFILISTLLTTVIITGVVSYYIFSSGMIKKIAQSRVDVLEKVSENLGTIKNSMLTISNLYFYNYPISEELKKSSISETDSSKILTALTKLNSMYVTAMDNKEIKVDYVVAMNNGFSYSTEGATQTNLITKYKEYLWYRDVVNNVNDITWVSSDSINTGAQKEYVFSAARCIKDENKNPIGLFLVYINENVISRVYENLVSDNKIYIIDQHGKIVSHVDKDLLGFNFYNMKMFNVMFKNKEYNTIKKSSKKFLFSKYFNNDIGWIIVEEIPLAILLTPLNKIRNMMAIVFVLVLIAGIFFSAIISRGTSRPLKRLCELLELVGRGYDGVTFDIRGWSEITKISDECNSMTKRINNLLDNVRRTELMERRAELDFLQIQINPHFMYNTLFSIKCMVGMGKSAQAEKMIDAFMSFLKNILGSRDELVTMEKELEILNEYVYIQKYRFGDKFDIEYICEEELKKRSILRLLLQPIVENSIIHGIGPKTFRGLITVKVERYNEDIMVSVRDNGVGMDADRVKLYDEEILHESNSIGINNVNSRIKLNFGEKYGLSIESETGEGTVVKIILPLIN